MPQITISFILSISRVLWKILSALKCVASASLLITKLFLLEPMLLKSMNFSPSEFNYKVSCSNSFSNCRDVKYSSASKFTVKELTKGHYTPNQQWLNEVWGLCVFHDGERYATCSDDATLRIWSISQKKQLKSMSLNIGKELCSLSP